MSWIKVENCTPDKPEIFQMADELKIDPDEVVGKMVRVWIWADNQTYDGNAMSVTSSLLDRVAGVTGFAFAMQNAGWLTATSGGFVFPNFERHNGKTAKTRGLTARRVKKHRNATGVTSALPEKRREDSTKSVCGNNGSAHSEPEDKKQRKITRRSAYTANFERFWLAFPAERKRSKADAWRAWKLHVTEDIEEAVIVAAGEYADSDEGRCKFVAGPAPWLNQERWEDDRKAWDRTVKDASDTKLQEEAAERRREQFRKKKLEEQRRRTEEYAKTRDSQRNGAADEVGFRLKSSDDG